MNPLELIRLVSAAFVLFSGCMTVGFLLSSIPHPPFEIDEITLISFDDGLTAQIEDALRTPYSSSDKDNTEVTWDAKLKKIMDREFKDSGISRDEWWGDEGADWTFLEKGPSSGVQHRRLSESKKMYDVVFHDDTTTANSNSSSTHRNDDAEDTKLKHTVLPILIVATAGLVTLCALLVWLCDIRDRRIHQEELEKMDDEPAETNRDTFLSSTASSFGDRSHSHAAAAAAARSLVLPPIDCVRDDDDELFHDQAPLSTVSSMTASLLVDNKKDNVPNAIGINIEAATDTSLYLPDGEENSLPDRAGSIAVSGTSSPDRSGVSALTEDSEIPAHRSTDSLDDAMSCHMESQKPFVETSDLEHGATGWTSVSDTRVVHNTSSEDFSASRKEDAPFQEGGVSIDHEKKNDWLNDGESVEKKSACVQEAVLPESDGSLGLDTKSTTSSNDERMGQVNQKKQPLVGNMCAGDVILNLSTSLAENTKSWNGPSADNTTTTNTTINDESIMSDRLSSTQNQSQQEQEQEELKDLNSSSDRHIIRHCIQLTVLGTHDDSFLTDDTTDDVDPREDGSN